jgi:nitroreductase
LSVPEEEMIFCGIALGYADERHPVNSLDSDRAPLEEWVRFKDA